MPKDFMCDRITADSPIRFLDFDASNMINLYRPSIPFILQTIFDEGRWRSKRDRICSTDGARDGLLKYRVRNPYHHHNDGKPDFYKTSWKHFCSNSRLMEKLQLIWKYRIAYHAGVNATEIGKECIAADKPTIALKIGDQTIRVDYDTPIHFGNSKEDQTKLIFNKEVNEIEKHLRRHGHILFNSGMGDGGCNGRRDMIHFKLVGGKSAHIGRFEARDRNRHDDRAISKWRKEVMKRQNVNLPYQIRGVNFNIPPLAPNVYMTKNSIMEIIRKEYDLDDAAVKKLNKKYNTKTIVKMYWKEIIDCV